MAICLQALEAKTFLDKEADKVTIGQSLNVKVPHAIMALMDHRGYLWLTNSCMSLDQNLTWKSSSIPRACQNMKSMLSVVVHDFNTSTQAEAEAEAQWDLYDTEANLIYIVSSGQVGATGDPVTKQNTKYSHFLIC